MAGEQPASVDKNFATNLREYREAEKISQEELARRMTDRGFGFSQNTIYTIEHGKRGVQVGEAVALAEALGVARWRDLTTEPARFQLGTNVDRANREMFEADEQLRAAAQRYINGQLNLTVRVREANDAGYPVSDVWQSWLSQPPEKAVLQARVELEHHDQDRERIDEAINRLMDALSEDGYTATFDPAAIEYG